MYWLFTDETNVTEKEGDFFIYGGVIITSEQMETLNRDVVAIRAKYGFKDGDRFKFQTASRPEQVSPEQFAEAKGEAIAALERRGALVVIYVVLHDVARNQDLETMTGWALNSLLLHFDSRFLEEKQDLGVVCIDRLDPGFGYSYMVDKFANGVTLPRDRPRKLPRIVHYSMSCDGASHMSSLTDIALGSMRFCINSATGRGNEDVARKILPVLSKAMWQRRTPDGGLQIGNYGFLQYPKDIRKPEYREKYRDLAQKLAEYAITEDESAA